MVNLRRYILQIENEMTGEWEPYAKRISRLAGGGFRVISDNKAAGEPDYNLVPENGSLVNSLTDKPVNVSVLGEILWPPDSATDRQVEIAARALERVLEQHGGF